MRSEFPRHKERRLNEYIRDVKVCSKHRVSTDDNIISLKDAQLELPKNCFSSRLIGVVITFK